jgi:hypothetical protein
LAIIYGSPRKVTQGRELLFSELEEEWLKKDSEAFWGAREGDWDLFLNFRFL